jgi:RNA polymerase sigma factor (sigma-70 family)
MPHNLSFEIKPKATILSSKEEKSSNFLEDESDIWIRFKNGDEKAFTWFYNNYVGKLYNYGERLTTDKALIEDSIHDLFVELWKNRVNSSLVTAVKVYLYKSFKNRLIKNINKKRKFPFHKISEDYNFEIVLSPEFDVITEQISSEQKSKLLGELNKLGSRQKEALTLRFFDELSYEQIAYIMAIPVKSVYMLIYRAIGFLKQNLNKINTVFALIAAACL